MWINIKNIGLKFKKVRDLNKRGVLTKKRGTNKKVGTNNNSRGLTIKSGGKMTLEVRH